MANEQLTNLQKLEIDKRVLAAKEEMDKQLVSYDKITELTGYGKEMITIIHRSVAKNTTVSELAYFLSVCKSSGLNPINKEIWCYKSGNDLVMFTGRDGFLKKNKEMGSYLGMKSSEVCEFDEFEIDMIEGIVKHKITNNRGPVIGGYAIVEHEGKRPTIVYLDFEEFNLKQAKWKTAPKMMIKKCAQSHALKEAAGVMGIAPEESAAVMSNGTVTFTAAKETKDQNKEDERLELLIERCDSEESLLKFKNQCTTPDLIEKFETKLAELRK